MTKSLYTILENMIVPALMLIFGKLIGIIAIVELENIQWSFNDFTNGILSGGTRISPNELLTVNTYSDLIMFVLFATYFSFGLLQAVYLHDSHVHPNTFHTFSRFNIVEFLKDSYEIYHAAAVNIVYLWIAVAIITINVALEKTDIWVSLFAMSSSVVLSTVLLLDVWREVHDTRTSNIV